MRLTRRHLLAAAPVTLMAATSGGCIATGHDAYAARAARLRAALDADPALPELVRFASLAANGHNTQPWRFLATATGIDLLPDPSRRTPVVDPDDHHLFVSLGCAIENLALAAAARGRAATPSPVRPEGRVAIELSAATRHAREDPLFLAITRRQSTRAAYDGSTVSNDILRQLETAARVEGVALRLLTAPTDLEVVLEHVLRGNDAQMDDPAFVAELASWIRFSPGQALATGDGLYAASSGNPVLPEWLGRRLFPLAFRKSAENERYATQLRSSSGVAVFVGERADPEHWVRVGRSFQRFALQATALGLRHAHVNQPVEVPAVRRDFAHRLGLGTARPDLVVRFGRGPQQPMALRRQVADVLLA